MLAQRFDRRGFECRHRCSFRPDISGVAELVATSTLPRCYCALRTCRHQDESWGHGLEFRLQHKMHFESMVLVDASKEGKLLGATEYSVALWTLHAARVLHCGRLCGTGLWGSELCNVAAIRLCDTAIWMVLFHCRRSRM